MDEQRLAYAKKELWRAWKEYGRAKRKYYLAWREYKCVWQKCTATEEAEGCEDHGN